MQIYIGENPSGDGFTNEEIKRGLIYLVVDIVCDICGTHTSYATVRTNGGVCKNCGHMFG